MDIVSVRHKGLKRLIEKDDDRLLPAKYRKKIRQLIAILIGLEAIEDFLVLPRGNPHWLKGNRSETYAISVYANWRLTFEYEAKTQSLHILDFEDYH